MEDKKQYMSLETLAELILQNDEFLPIVGLGFWADSCLYASGHPDKRLEDNFSKGTENLGKQMQSDRMSRPEKLYIQKIVYFIDHMNRARKNPDTPEAQNFVARLKNISRLFYTNRDIRYLSPESIKVLEPMPRNEKEIENMRLMMLQKFNQVQNEETKHQLLKYLSRGVANESSPASQKMAITLRANSPLATVDDLEYLSYITPQHDVATFQKLYEDADKMTSSFLAKELAKESPNMQEVQRTIDTSLRIAYRAQQAKAITGAQYQEQVDKYKMEKLIMPDAVAYMQKLSTADVAKIDALQKQVAELQANLERIKQELAAERTALMDSKQQNAELSRENESLRRANDSLGQSKENTEDKLKKLIAAAQRMSSGILSSGVKEYQKMAEDMGNSL